MGQDGVIKIAIDEAALGKVHTMPEMQVACLSIAKKVAAIARETAPVKSGLYASKIEAQQTRGGARVYAADQKSSWIEFGIPSHNQPAHWNLRNAAVAAGLGFGGDKGSDREMVQYTSKAGRTSTITRRQAENYSRSRVA